MGLAAKMTLEMEIKSPVKEFFHGMVDHAILFSKALPDGLHKSEVHEGDGKSPGSINSFSYVLEEDTALTAKSRVEAIDEENKSLKFEAFDGHVGEFYSKFKVHVQIFTKDDKNFVNYTLEYEKLIEEVPEPINYMGLVAKFNKGLDAHLVQA
ncbi:MLP-like protein 423 isoform X2 [Telopea speciosissima]|uniref:MLP-like protein 423 isoform X2 n=1 Tax=Telopea speciosissima TaxID=54955 RepID=UPI001CC6CB83|nr:MLP-like protein 423 isoform X2 [Telopea speciosissima]